MSYTPCSPLGAGHIGPPCLCGLPAEFKRRRSRTPLRWIIACHARAAAPAVIVAGFTTKPLRIHRLRCSPPSHQGHQVFDSPRRPQRGTKGFARVDVDGSKPPPFDWFLTRCARRSNPGPRLGTDAAAPRTGPNPFVPLRALRALRGEKPSEDRHTRYRLLGDLGGEHRQSPAPLRRSGSGCTTKAPRSPSFSIHHEEHEEARRGLRASVSTGRTHHRSIGF